jgi:sialate O-acetylesterase
MSDLTLSPLFQNGCVLQCGQRNHIWGTAQAGASIEFSCRSKRYTTVAAPDGRWELVIEPLPIGGPYECTVRDNHGNQKTVTDVLSGEVWICSGQSNMEWTLSQLPHLVDLRDRPSPLIRYFRHRTDLHARPAPDVTGTRKSTTGREAGECSAVALAFAEQIQEKLQRPIGLIVNALGGTFIESWIPNERVSASTAGHTRQQLVGPNRRQAHEKITQMSEDLDRWLAHSHQPDNAATIWSIPPNHNFSAGWIVGNQLGACYNTYIAPLRSLACAGVLWYQGESNANAPEDYEELFAMMVASWREQLARPDLPFLTVQLAGWESAEEARSELTNVPREDGFPGLRRAQAAAATQPGIAMATAIDVGHRYDIHPLEKDVVGQRLARLALNPLYDYPCNDCGPVLSRAVLGDGRVHVAFDQDVATKNDSTTVMGFFIQNDQGIWQAVNGQLAQGGVKIPPTPTDTVRAVSYAECSYQDLNLVNHDGLPALPGRLNIESAWTPPTPNNVGASSI